MTSADDPRGTEPTKSDTNTSNDTESQVKPQAEQPETPTDESQPSQPDGPPPTWEEVFGHERFKQLLKRARDAETKLAKFEKAQAQAEQEKLKEQQRWQELFQQEQARAEQLATELATSKAQAAFYEQARQAGVTNLGLAYIAARENGLLDEAGVADLELLKERFPELFRQKAVMPPGNAGSGAGAPARQASMNDFIRVAAGRRP